PLFAPPRTAEQCGLTILGPEPGPVTTQGLSAWDLPGSLADQKEARNSRSADFMGGSWVWECPPNSFGPSSDRPRTSGSMTFSPEMSCVDCSCQSVRTFRRANRTAARLAPNRFASSVGSE